MTPESVALRLLEMALAVAPVVIEAVTGTDAATLDERISRARLAVREPVDTSQTDAERRAEVRRIVRGGE